MSEEQQGDLCEVIFHCNHIPILYTSQIFKNGDSRATKWVFLKHFKWYFKKRFFPIYLK